MTQTQLYEIQEQYLRRRMDIETVLELFDEAIGGIRSVAYKPGLKLKFMGGDGELYDWQHVGLSNKKLARVEDFVMVAYEHARASGSRLPGEAHLGKARSTKHHSSGFKKQVKRRFAA